jgi:hypothetical protein
MLDTGYWMPDKRIKEKRQPPLLKTSVFVKTSPRQDGGTSRISNMLMTRRRRKSC